MSSGRIRKDRRKAKPSLYERERLNRVADYLSSIPENEAMVFCNQCVQRNIVCYFDSQHSKKCAECLRYQRRCDGTFSLEELRQVGEQKRKLQAEARSKQTRSLALRSLLQDARKALMDAEKESLEADTELAALEGSIAKLDEVSGRMLRREMQALGAFDDVEATQGSGQEVALADPNYVWSELPAFGSSAWDEMFSGPSGNELSVPG